MSNHNSKPEILAELAEDFIVRFRNGERRSVDEYISRHPQWEDDIRQMINSLIMIERRAAGDEDPAAGDDDRLQPRQIGDFRIIRQVGRGGMGTVFVGKWDGNEVRRQVDVPRGCAVRVELCCGTRSVHRKPNPKRVRFVL